MAQEKILIADDEPYVLDVCKRILEKSYYVKIVHSGLEAIQVMQHERFDLLLTDIKMPGIDGLETAKEIKNMASKSKEMRHDGSSETVCLKLLTPTRKFISGE